MQRRKLWVTGAAIAALAGGAGIAVGAASDEAKKRESAVLSSAAKDLGVSADDLKSALGKAQDAQIDQAVKDGKITQAQADEMKKRRAETGLVLGGPGGRHGGPGGPGGPGGRRGGKGFGGRAVMEAVAKELGLTEAQLHDQLHDGKTLAEIAKAKGKTLDELKAVAKKAGEAEIDAAVKDGKLTAAQAKDAKAHLAEHIARLGEGRGFGGKGRRGPGGPPPGAPGTP